TGGAAAAAAGNNNNNTINENKRRRVKRQIQMIALGVQDAGKSHAVKLLKGEAPKDLTSSVGFSSHQFNYDKGFDIGIYDVGGRPSIRNIWYNYLAECHALIFIVNLQDMQAETIDESAQLLKDLGGREDVHGKPIMLVLNRPPPDFDEIAFVNRDHIPPVQMGLHEPPFNADQRFHIIHMLEYNGYLDHQKPSTSPFVIRSKNHSSDKLLQGFSAFVDKVVTEFVLLDVGVSEARRRLEERIVRDKAARAARAALREQQERDRAAGIEETPIDEPPAAAAAAAVADSQPGPSGVANAAFENNEDTVAPIGGSTVEEELSPISREFEEDRPSSRAPSIQSSALHPPRPLPHPPGETGIMGELSPQPERPPPVSQPLPPIPAPRKISNASTKTIFVDSRTTLKLSRMERIQMGIQSKTKPKEPMLNGHVNTAYLPEVA
ncbi:hypothetical protein PMAYCL1PPCAC_22995, partial [Pristionchus mayeri]